jgi:dTDP-4-dehydrorhamnose reductase
MGKIIVLGGTGLLGSELKKLDQDLICLGSNDCDITENFDLGLLFKIYDFETIILAAAELTTAPNLALITTNIIGASNVARACLIAGKRLIYISSDYVYPGTSGNYKETDPVLPVNNYAWSKLGGECAVRMVPNHLIIRTSFGSSEFPHEYAYNNMWTSKDHVDVIAPMILEASKSDLTGIINIGTEKKTMLDYARRRNPNITGKPLTDNTSPRDSSLNLSKWKSFHKSILPAESADMES